LSMFTLVLRRPSALDIINEHRQTTTHRRYYAPSSRLCRVQEAKSSAGFEASEEGEREEERATKINTSLAGPLRRHTSCLTSSCLIPTTLVLRRPSALDIINEHRQTTTHPSARGATQRDRNRSSGVYYTHIVERMARSSGGVWLSLLAFAR
jgi:hypothetical protein